MKTTVVGSYPKPKWLKYVPEKDRLEAIKDAVRAVVKDQEVAGVEIISDGEVWRDEMTSYFANRIDGFVIYGEVRVWGNTYYPKPAIVDELRYRKPILLQEFEFLKKVTDRKVKVPITGAYTLVDWSFNEYYNSKEEAVYALAEILNEEVKRLVKAGADFIQIDEPAINSKDLEVVENAIEITLKGIKVYTALHICYNDYRKLFPGVMDLNVNQLDLEFANRKFEDLEILKEYSFDKDLGFGCIDVHSKRVESVEEIFKAIEKALEVVDSRKLYVDPDCGLKLLPRSIAFRKLKNMCEAVKRITFINEA